MNLHALDLFACPTCKGQLDLTILHEVSREVSAEDQTRAQFFGVDPGTLNRVVEEGVLTCAPCTTWYPVTSYVPVLLDYETGLHREFRERFKDRPEAFGNSSPPKGKPRKGELFVQRSFSTEWRNMKPDQISFVFTPEERDKFIGLELDWPPDLLQNQRLRVLEVGCGSGFESQSLERVTKGRIIGVDLNLSLLFNGKEMSRHPFVDVAVASLFALPARKAAFDLVYSSGVIHHTWSTKAAFDEIFTYRKPDGTIYIWVYAMEDLAHSITARLNWDREVIFRPLIARLPGFLQNMVVKVLSLQHYVVYKMKSGALHRKAWKFKNSEHDVRDRWTPLYAHRHGFREVINWFLEKGLDYRLINPRKYVEVLKSIPIGVGIRGTPEHAEAVSGAQ